MPGARERSVRATANRHPHGTTQRHKHGTGQSTRTTEVGCQIGLGKTPPEPKAEVSELGGPAFAYPRRPT